jgi:predicted alpha/beta-fold hydrolase
MLTNYCGEEGPNCVLKGAVVCSNPFNLDVSSKILQNSYIGKEVYLRIMGSELFTIARFILLCANGIQVL